MFQDASMVTVARGVRVSSSRSLNPSTRRVASMGTVARVCALGPRAAKLQEELKPKKKKETRRHKMKYLDVNDLAGKIHRRVVRAQLTLVYF
ncbi:hypothetical protein NDU88_002154 [Pleurodeles waltl]|uniref:Uncharacterized protein n=1 Tax=Pleurodeles waltl TaxID=8319 RepID=A0AAV7VC20_PLEWA|nr:hypothetical protein NDU88_002154 [Pleurodeles waltl]